MEVSVKILFIHNITHDVRQFRLEKPEGFVFHPGEATELSVDRDGWRDIGSSSPFTFTCLSDAPYLEFTIKLYPGRNRVTNQLSQLNVGDRVILREPWGTIAYKGAGYFIAGGAGITPFLAILRQLHREGRAKQSKLFYSNKTDDDIILADELRQMLGDNAHFCISRQTDSRYDTRRIDEQFLRSEVDDFGKHFYVCGPDTMVLAITQTLKNLGAHPDAVVFEK